MTLAILLAVTLAGLPWGPGAVAKPAAAGRDSVAGRKVYEQRKCATCHMIAGQGNVRFKLDGVASRLSREDLRRWLTETDAMERALPQQPAVRMSEWLESNRKISDADVEALVAYLYSLK
jgi:mono/diheme cytochrome c family protein